MAKRRKNIKKNRTAKNSILIISICLSVLVFFVESPYFLVQSVRSLTFIGYVMLAYFAFKVQKWLWVAVFLALGMFFQPCREFLGTETIWNIIDVILLIFFVYALYKVIHPIIK